MSLEGVAIVMLTHGGEGADAPLVEGLVANGAAASSIVVVHNPLAPGEAMPKVPPGCEVVQSERNLGYAAGMNLGIRRWRERGARLLLILTHDAKLRDGALDRLLGAADQHPDYWVLAPALVLSGTDVPFSFGGTTRPNGTTFHRKTRPQTSEEGIAASDWVDGGTMLVRMEAIDRVGEFDERFWGYCEEADLCLRIRRVGRRVGVVLDAVAEQEPGAAARPGVWAYLLTRNGAEYARRVAGIRGALTVELRAAGTVGLSLLRVLVRMVRKRPGGPREPWLLAMGTARGGLDFLRGRWGPPPSSLPGMGDVRNV